MLKRLKKTVYSFLCLIILCGLLLSTLPFTAFAADNEDVYYIKSDYTSGAYFYEADGTLRYGTPLEGDKSFQWYIEENASVKTIKNAKTGHYLTLEGYKDLVKVSDFKEDNDKFLWKFEIGESQNILSASSEYTNTGLHIQDIADGHVAADALAGNELSWGNMLWNFLTADEINFSATGRDGFCIQNVKSKDYLKADSDSLTYSKPSGPDDTFIWNIELLSDGSKTIVNKANGKYLGVNNGNAILSDKAYSWNVQIGLGGKITDSDNKTGLAYQEDYKLTVADINSLTGSDSCWNIITASEVGNVAGDLKLDSDKAFTLCNSWFEMYLIEVDGVPVYGNADPADKNAQWNIIYDENSGLSALVNVGTGHYVHSGNGPEGLVCDDEAVSYWKVLRNKNDLYPEGIIFQDSTDSTKYLHMENLTGSAENSGAVQPTWGTPHWVPTEVKDNASSSSTGTLTDAPTGYVRFKSSYDEEQYLYMTKAGGIAYGKLSEGDARSHFQFVESETAGSYYLVNREYGLYVQNMGSGVLRSFEAESVTGEGCLWQIRTGSESSVLICNAYSSLPEFQLPCINIQDLSGLAKSTLVSYSDETALWIWEEAPDKVDELSASAEVSVPLTVIGDSNTYNILVNGEEKSGEYKLEYYGSSARLYNADNNKYLYAKNGKLKTKTLNRTNDTSVNFSVDDKLGATHLTANDVDITLIKVKSDAVYYATDAYLTDKALTFSVYAPKGGEYSVNIDGKNESELLVNGIPQENVTLPCDVTLELNKGMNTIKLSGNIEINKLTVKDSININTYGAASTYVTYEAEDCETNADVLEENFSFTEIATEASGRSGVNLSGTSKNIKFTLTEDTNTILLRYCIPDSENGEGQQANLSLYADGTKIKELELSSKHSWLYKETENCTNNPSDGLPHNYFDETAFILDETLKAGTEIKLQKDVSSYAEYYIIDLIETELIEGPLAQPKNSLSITDFGAVANDGADDTAAFTACLNQAVSEGKEVFVPAGKFDVPFTYSLNQGNVVIRGAGMWYTTINDILFEVSSNNLAFYDFSMRGPVTLRDNEGDRAAFQGTSKCDGFLAQNLWIQHYKCGFWMTFSDRVHLVGCRVRDVYADGINLQSECENCMIEHSDFRNTGDDAIAMWSEFGNSNGNIVKNNTVSLPNLANCIALYGGTNITIKNNLVKDTVNVGAGVNISTNFKPQDRFAGTITIAENRFIRCGSLESQNGNNIGSLWFNTPLGYDNSAQVIAKDNAMIQSVCQGISFEGSGKITNVTLEGNYIDTAGTMGVQVLYGCCGCAIMKNNVIDSSMLDEYYNASADTFSLVINNSELVTTDIWSNPLMIAVVISGGLLSLAGTATLIYILFCDIKGKKLFWSK